MIPIELADIEAETELVGDIDAFMRCYEAGYMAAAYEYKIRVMREQIERMYGFVEQPPQLATLYGRLFRLVS